MQILHSENLIISLAAILSAQRCALCYAIDRLPRKNFTLLREFAVGRGVVQENIVILGSWASVRIALAGLATIMGGGR